MLATSAIIVAMWKKKGRGGIPLVFLAAIKGASLSIHALAYDYPISIYHL